MNNVSLLDKYDLRILDIIPNFNQGMRGVGFLFGAGTSFEAGYPLSNILTMQVINALSTTERNLIEQVINNHNKVHAKDYSLSGNQPDIEVLLNILYSAINGPFIQQIDELTKLERSIKHKIVNEITGVINPDISHHMMLFSKIKQLIGHRHEPFWVFTTNYDLLFEHACMHSKIPIRNGFSGSIARYFDINRIGLVHGKQNKERQIEPYKEPFLKLIKLHGSISWYKENSAVYEISDGFNFINTKDYSRVMIFPRGDKVFETLGSPYQSLFDYSNKIIGKKCQYLICSGYSFRDQHINERLLIPKLSEGKLRIFAFFKDEPEHIQVFKEFPCFNYLTQDKLFINQIEYEYKSDLWMFSKFVDFLCK